MCRVECDDGWIWRGLVGGDVQAPGDFLVNAASAASVATADAGVVEGRVVRAEVASAAVPQRRHCGMGRDGTGSWWYSQDGSEVDDQRRQDKYGCIVDQYSRRQNSQGSDKTGKDELS